MVFHVDSNDLEIQNLVDGGGLAKDTIQKPRPVNGFKSMGRRHTCYIFDYPLLAFSQKRNHFTKINYLILLIIC